MIAKGKSISHGTAALEYDLAKEINGEAAATEIHRHELFGCTGEEMVQEMKPYFVDFPNVKNNCLRFEVSPSVEESAGMTDADWAKLGNDFMQRMGLMNHQYIIVKHSGTEKNSRQAHLHILANRVSLSGELYKDNWIGKRATEAANSIARERNLVQSKDIGKANREEIKQAMDSVLTRMQGFDLAGFSRELGKLGFKVREARASTGKLNGYYVEARSGTEYKGLLAHFTQIYHLYNLLIYNILRRNLQLFITEFCIFSPCIIFISNKNSDKSIEILHISPKYITSVDNLMIHIFSSTFNFLYSFTPSDRLESKS